MTKRIIIAIVAIFVLMSLVTMWIFSSFENSAKEAADRMEADFTTQKFVITELWEMQQKKNSQVLSSYLFMKVRQEKVHLRLPWQGVSDREAVVQQLSGGDTIEVKVLKNQLAAARKEGVLKAVERFVMGDKREVTLFDLSVHNKVLVHKDIHDWDEAKVTLLGRVTSNPLILLVPAFILFAIIGVVKRKAAAKRTVS